MRNRVLSKLFFPGLTFLLFGFLASPARADFPVGTWLRTDTEGKGITVTVSVCCNGGRRLVYHVPIQGQPPVTMTVDLPPDGSEAPLLVGGKPTGQTMTMKVIDDRHFQGTVLVNGQLSGTYTDTISADGKTLTAEGSTIMPGGAKRKVVETWVRQ